MGVIRTPLTLALPVPLADVKLRARIDHDEEDAALEVLIREAAADVEAAADLALLPQTVTITAEAHGPRERLVLPIGPVLAGGVSLVETLDADGAAEALSGWWLEPGRYGVLSLPEATDAALRVTYTAALALTPEALPADLRHAIMDQAARLYDERGGVSERGPSLSPHAARVIARYRRVGL